MTQISSILGLDLGVVLVLLGLGFLLVGGTVARGIRRLVSRDRRSVRAWRSLLAWWVLYVLFVILLVLGRPAVMLGMLLVSLLCLKETLALVTAQNFYFPLAFLTLIIYVWVWLAWESFYGWAIPLAGLSAGLVALLQTRIKAGALSRILWIGLAYLMAVIGPSFVVAVADLPVPWAAGDGGPAWFLLLVVLTEWNDIAQAWWGRAVGSRSLAPTISPSKTWEGLLGGMISTVLVTLLLFPLVLSQDLHAFWEKAIHGPAWLEAASLGILVSLAGIGGDLTASVLKRRKGVKDAGQIIPAQGGILDRFDSLAFTAPAFFFLALYLIRTSAW